MRVSIFLLLAALPALAQGTERHWYLDVHRFTPSLSGHYQGSSGGQPFQVDFRNDLALDLDTTRIGYSLEYQGPRFGLELSRDEQDYAGSNRIPRSVTINGQTFTASTLVTSRFKATNDTLNWTIRYLTWPRFWLGLDLGGRVTETELNASGVDTSGAVTASVRYRINLPVAQAGPSLGFASAGGTVVGRASYHLLAYRHSTYGHASADLRVFPLSWLGFRAFAEAERLRIPAGSVRDDLDLTLDRSGTGFGVVVRF